MVRKLNLMTFLKKICIKFEYETFKTEITFLDTTVFKIKVYVKPTDRQSYLHSK